MYRYEDESTHLDYVQQTPEICHLGSISPLKAYMIFECILSFQLSSSNSIRSALIQMAIPQVREILGTRGERILGVFRKPMHFEEPF